MSIRQEYGRSDFDYGYIVSQICVGRFIRYYDICKERRKKMSTITIVMLIVYVVVFGGGSVFCIKKSLTGNKQQVTAEGEEDGFASRIGYILSTIGMAVGVGAMWRFPMLCAKWGGGAFVLAFIIITIALVIPAGFAETAYGRLKKKEHMSGMSEDGGLYGKILGALCSIDQVFLWGYYPAIQGLVIAYIFKTITQGVSYADNSEEVWDSMNGNRALQYGLIVLLLILTAIITVRGIKNGIEKICKIMLPALGVILVVLVICVCTIDGIGEGIEYYVKPDWSVLVNPSMWADAAGMALFAVGLGPGILYAYGRYTNKKQDIAMDFVSVNVIQLAVCLMSGFVIIPAVKVFGFDPMMGKGIMFVALPKVFQSLPGGAIFMVLFFAALLFAGISSSISQLEVGLSIFTDKMGFNLTRKKATIVSFFVAALVAIPCAFNDAFFAIFDTIIGSIGYDLCALGIAVLIAWKFGAAKIREEYNLTSEIKWGGWIDVMYKYVFVIVMAFFTVQAIVDLF